MNSSVLRSFPVRLVGAFVALVIAGIVLYLIGAFSMYVTAWVVWLVQAIFG